MKILKFILKIFYHPFTHNPEDFKIELVPRWEGSEYVCYRYTANGGFNWRYVMCSSRPFLGCLNYDWDWEILSFKLWRDSDSDNVFGNYNTYQKILNHEKSEWNKYLEGQKDIKRQRENIRVGKIEQLKQINSYKK